MSATDQTDNEAVKHTGKFGHVWSCSQVSITQSGATIENEVRAMITRELGTALLRAMSDGRRYTVVSTIERHDNTDIVEFRGIATVLLIDPADAQIGEFVWRDPKKPGRPNFAFADVGLAHTRWSMVSLDAWERIV